MLTNHPHVYLHTNNSNKNSTSSICWYLIQHSTKIDFRVHKQKDVQRKDTQSVYVRSKTSDYNTEL